MLKLTGNKIVTIFCSNNLTGPEIEIAAMPFVFGAQKSHFNETFLLSTQCIYLSCISKIIFCYALWSKGQFAVRNMKEISVPINLSNQ